MKVENLPKPFLGRLVVEAIKESVEDHLAKLAKLEDYKELSKMGFQIVAAETTVDEYTGEKKLQMKKGIRTPIKRGRILKVSPDAFGDRFLEKCGMDVGDVPTIGDVVWFIPNDTYQIDQEGKYHIINDCDVVAVDEKKEIKEKENEEVTND